MDEKKLSIYIGSKIKDLRKRKKITQGELGKKIGVKNNTISAYERGAISTDQDILFKLADALEVSINDFFPPVSTERGIVKEKEVNYNVKKSHGRTYFPTAISAGLPLEVDGMTESSTITVSDEILGRYKNDRDIFFARINGDSMNNLMQDESLIAIKPVSSADELKNGDIVVYSVDGEYSVKHFYKYGGTLVFKPNSTNDAHKEHEYNAKEDDIQIHGKVVTYIVNVD